MRDLAVTHSCILSLALLTPFTLSPSVDVFFAFRMIQTALMGQYVLLHPRANSKLQALLKGTPLRRIFLLHIMGRFASRPPMFQTFSSCVCSFLPYR